MNKSNKQCSKTDFPDFKIKSIGYFLTISQFVFTWGY